MDARSEPSPGEAQISTSNESRLQLLIDAGLRLASERDLDVIVDTALNAGARLANASAGAVVYCVIHDDGESSALRRTLGFSSTSLPVPEPRELLGALGESMRVDDLTAKDAVDPVGIPWEQVSIRSYLAIPIISQHNEVLAALALGAREPNAFSADHERMLQTLAAQTGAAIENARLAQGLQREIALSDNAKALQQATASRLEQVMESTTDGVVLLDRDWRFTYVNRYANEVIAPGKDLAGMRFWDLFSEGVNGPLHGKYQRAMEHGEQGEFTEYCAPLKIWAQVRVFPTPEGIAIFFQDVTPKREAERERAETSRRLRQALDAGQLGTWSWDKETDLLDLDERAADILGAEPHLPITRTALRERIVLSDDLPLTPENLKELADSGEAYRSEYRTETPAGQRWVSSRGLPTLSEDGAFVTGMTGTVQDVTSQKTQEAVLRQTEKLAATGRMAATIAHEINNPLEAVTNLIYLSKTDPSVGGEVQHFLELADTELARVSQIAQQTLGFYRDTSHPVDIDLSGLLHGVADLFSRKLHSRNLRIDLDVHDDLHIFGLQGEVRQVFSNLMVNAIDASTKEGIIRVRARPRSLLGVGGVAVMICDEGGGIPHGIRHKLFAPFFTTKQSVGTGLGLWVTRGIVEKSGGKVGFRSRTDPPTGTVFRVFLPNAKFGKEFSPSPETTILQ